jgi:DNA-binding NtrC family response regulator
MSRATKTILICDDDQGMRDTLTAILKRDYRVLTVSSGEAALGLLKNEGCRGSAGSTCCGSSRRTTASSSAS